METFRNDAATREVDYHFDWSQVDATAIAQVALVLAEVGGFAVSEVYQQSLTTVMFAAGAWYGLLLGGLQGAKELVWSFTSVDGVKTLVYGTKALQAEVPKAGQANGRNSGLAPHQNRITGESLAQPRRF